MVAKLLYRKPLGASTRSYSSSADRSGGDVVKEPYKPNKVTSERTAEREVANFEPVYTIFIHCMNKKSR